MTRADIAAATRRYQRAISWLLGIAGISLVVYFLAISPGRSTDPMLTPFGSRFDYMITAPTVIAYIVLLYLWSIWSAIFLAPRKEVVATLSTVLTGVAIWLWTLDVARPVVSVLLVLGLAHGVLVIGQTLHRDSTGASE